MLILVQLRVVLAASENLRRSGAEVHITMFRAAVVFVERESSGGRTHPWGAPVLTVQTSPGDSLTNGRRYFRVKLAPMKKITIWHKRNEGNQKKK